MVLIVHNLQAVVDWIAERQLPGLKGTRVWTKPIFSRMGKKQTGRNKQHPKGTFGNLNEIIMVIQDHYHVVGLLGCNW